MKKKLIVLFGGKSVEHDISIITALQVMKLVPKEYVVTPVYVQKNGRWCIGNNLNEVDAYVDFPKGVKKKREVFLKFGSPYLFCDGVFGSGKLFKVDCALICLHGNYGEDGSICASLDMCNIPYTSSGHTSCAICMDKIFAKFILDAENISNARYVYFEKNEYKENKECVFNKIKNELGYPVIVKPANLGSSVGISVAQSEEELDEKIQYALEFDNRILIEEFLSDSEEFNCACMTIDGEVISSKVISVDKGEFFSFDEKYIVSSTKKEKKCKTGVQKQVSSLAKRIYKLFDCKGIVRIDFLKKDEKIYVNEINSIPGSLSIHMFDGISKKELIENVIKEAKKNFEDKEKYVFSFDSDALKTYKTTLSNVKTKKFH